MKRVSRGVLLAASALVLLGSSACRKRVSAAECDAMLGHFAELVVREQFPDAGADVLEAERARERREAKGDDAFKSCTSEVQPTEHACAMKATSAEALLKCLD